MGKIPSFALAVLAAAALAPRTSAETISELRILVEKIPASSRRSFVLEGQAIMDADGKPVRNDKISCGKSTPVASPLLSGENGADVIVSWICRAAPHSWTVKKPLRFSDRSGFLRIGKKWYRGAIELVPQGETLWVVNKVDVEDYLVGLLHGEMPKSFEPEALKAQIVAARSYAIATARERRAAGAAFDLQDNPFDQMYPGAHTESFKGERAVLATSGEYLVTGAEILKSFYHAASGGFSEVPSNVWKNADAGTDASAYVAQPNPWDKGFYAWTLALSPELFRIYPEIGEVVDIQVAERTAGARVTRIRIVGSKTDREVSIQELERLFGPSWFKSRKFDIARDGKSWKILGEGWGHGVGLSQVAANNMAKAGKTYKQILEFHYPQAKLKRLVNNSPQGLIAEAMAR
jgi:stage II sporulation protein D